MPSVTHQYSGALGPLSRCALDSLIPYSDVTIKYPRSHETDNFAAGAAGFWHHHHTLYTASFKHFQRCVSAAKFDGQNMQYIAGMCVGQENEGFGSRGLACIQRLPQQL